MVANGCALPAVSGARIPRCHDSSGIVVLRELAAITWIRHHYMDTPPLSAALQVGLGGTLVFVTGVLIGNA
jgi:hypothetical protein